jgi:membrane protein YqaA with SNARE-associated domain
MSLTAYLWALFGSAFISSTLLPGGSEALVLLGIRDYPSNLWLIIAVATVGNTLGALVTYAMGRLFPNKVKKPDLKWLERFGYLLLLFTWVPVIGDGFCLGAGWMRMKFWPVSLLILIGKFMRYAAIACTGNLLFAS